MHSKEQTMRTHQTWRHTFRRHGVRIATAAAAATAFGGGVAATIALDGGGIASAATTATQLSASTGGTSTGGTSTTSGTGSASGTRPAGTPSGCPGMGPGLGRPTVTGTVLSVDTASGSFTLQSPAGTTYTVDVTASTTYRDPGQTSPSLDNVTKGEQVAVRGTLSSTTVTANTVLIGGPMRPGAPVGAHGYGPAGDQSGSAGQGSSSATAA
jgi:hypothetical protein